MELRGELHEAAAQEASRLEAVQSEVRAARRAPHRAAAHRAAPRRAPHPAPRRATQASGRERQPSPQLRPCSAAPAAPPPWAASGARDAPDQGLAPRAQGPRHQAAAPAQVRPVHRDPAAARRGLPHAARLDHAPIAALQRESHAARRRARRAPRERRAAPATGGPSEVERRRRVGGVSRAEGGTHPTVRRAGRRLPYLRAARGARRPSPGSGWDWTARPLYRTPPYLCARPLSLPRWGHFPSTPRSSSTCSSSST